MRLAKLSFVAAVGIWMLAAIGCPGLMNQEAAVQKAIQDHLAARSDLAMDKMTMVMEQVTVSGDTAQAEVVFGVAGDPQSRMSYHYELHREGGRWMVDGGRPRATPLPHPQMGEMMEEGMPDEPASAEPLHLPEGHPPVQPMNPHGEDLLPSTGL